MTELTKALREYVREPKKAGTNKHTPPENPKDWYINRDSIDVAVNWPQRVFAEVEDQENEADEEYVPNRIMDKLIGEERWKSREISPSFSSPPNPTKADFEHFVLQLTRQTPTLLFAYTDFDRIPLYAWILILAATSTEHLRIPARRIFLERCKKTLHGMGLPEEMLTKADQSETARQSTEMWLKHAHMVACLEEQAATEGYLTAAIHFEKLTNTRSALACVYRNVRYRMRDRQILELNEDVSSFDIKSAGLDTMLAVLTATAPLKSQLPVRKHLFRKIRRELKKRGQFERGLLDGLK